MRRVLQKEEGGCFTALPQCYSASLSLGAALILLQCSFLPPDVFFSSCYLETEENMLTEISVSMAIMRLYGKVAHIFN